MPTVIKKLDPGAYQLKDQVVAINRVTKVVKGGKNLSFAALVVVGDPTAAVVGYGSGKAKEVPQAIRKGIESAKKNLVRVNLTHTSIPHAVLGRFGSGMVLLKPGWERGYDGRPAVYPIGCSGVVTHVERLADGRFNIVLRGLERFRIVEENHERRYRRALVEPLVEQCATKSSR